MKKIRMILVAALLIWQVPLSVTASPQAMGSSVNQISVTLNDCVFWPMC